MKSSKFSKKLKCAAKKAPIELIDLHIHSKFSDGELSVLEIIDVAVNKHLKAIAITDHDTIDGYHEGKDYARDAGIEFIPGVELSSYTDGSEIHILGYGFDTTNLNLNMTLQELQKKRKIRAERIVNKLKTCSIDINLDRVFEKVKGTSVGRPHIAAVMLDEEYISTFHEAFEKYLTADFIREFETEKLTPGDAIELIKHAGGIAVLAHPAQTSRDDLLESFVESGLEGIEIYCGSTDNAAMSRYKAFVKKYNLVSGGGSDFHNGKGGAKSQIGSVRTPYPVLEKIKSRIPAFYV